MLQEGVGRVTVWQLGTVISGLGSVVDYDITVIHPSTLELPVGPRFMYQAQATLDGCMTDETALYQKTPHICPASFNSFTSWETPPPSKR